MDLIYLSATSVHESSIVFVYIYILTNQFYFCFERPYVSPMENIYEGVKNKVNYINVNTRTRSFFL